MGAFSVTLEIGDPQGQRYEAVRALVDTGSSYSVAPASLLRRLGITPFSKWPFDTGDGRRVDMDVGRTWVRVDGQAEITLIVFGQEGKCPLGAYTLEGLRLAPDPVHGRLMQVPGLL